MKKITVSKAIGEALHEEMLRDKNVFIMGEDMAVMGNVFAITKGFLEEFGPNRVIDTPISEEGFVGMAVGAAMRGLRPVVELMYDDFATECADPLFNQAAKIRYMTGGQCMCLWSCGPPWVPDAATPASTPSLWRTSSATSPA